MRTIFSTDHVAGAVKEIPGKGRVTGVAWFDLVLHDGPADQTTWDGCGQTVAHWRTQFSRFADSASWRVGPAGIEGVPDAIIPDTILGRLTGGDRISFLWNFVSSEATRTSSEIAATTDRASRARPSIDADSRRIARAT